MGLQGLRLGPAAVYIPKELKSKGKKDGRVGSKGGESNREAAMRSRSDDDDDDGWREIGYHYLRHMISDQPQG
jgi:hypothetical protein